FEFCIANQGLEAVTQVRLARHKRSLSAFLDLNGPPTQGRRPAYSFEAWTVFQMPNFIFTRAVIASQEVPDSP
ncbi:hypothetical protein, partial [Pseudomonas fulva]|uniref:hypothetical protein n=1 Tax=Pseudomonas fulva TaxID=47880 RepID=UPI001C8BDE3B